MASTFTLEIMCSRSSDPNSNLLITLKHSSASIAIYSQLLTTQTWYGLLAILRSPEYSKLSRRRLPPRLPKKLFVFMPMKFDKHGQLWGCCLLMTEIIGDWLSSCCWRLNIFFSSSYFPSPNPQLPFFPSSPFFSFVIKVSRFAVVNE